MPDRESGCACFSVAMESSIAGLMNNNYPICEIEIIKPEIIATNKHITAEKYNISPENHRARQSSIVAVMNDQTISIRGVTMMMLHTNITQAAVSCPERGVPRSPRSIGRAKSEVSLGKSILPTDSNIIRYADPRYGAARKAMNIEIEINTADTPSTVFNV